ncbi:kinase inhibitor [Lithospermum erythrorhizon]|uniref:Kinase inhibitor n=1 Tax=Lithospermum erythrorhizon TaxID=34254 RepID=A0AAV3NPB9_LITER
MGKYIRKSKVTSEVNGMELRKSTLGVRTRAKTLALQRLQDLQLRSRRLHKPFLGFAQTSKLNQTKPQLQNIQQNNFHFQPIGRATRESTPCNVITDVDNISTPGSSTRYPENQTPRSSILPNIPSMREVDELFAHFEQQQQRFFMEKYNFDIINDVPLPGRYEWVKVSP